jgi:hypothetical protein
VIKSVSTDKVKLSQVFGLLPKPKYVLGTTYTLSLAFFESVVFPFIGRSDLRSCLILCDLLGYQRALTEGAALQGAAQDYIVVPSPLADCFHPKVWLLVGESDAVLLCGSGNLTQAGFMTNAELFDALHFSDETPATPELLDSIRGFISGLAQMWAQTDAQHLLCVETLSRIEESLSALPVAAAAGDGSLRFVHSFNSQLIEQMPELPGARELYVAAPFFGNSLNGLNLLASRYPATKLKVFPAVYGETATDAPLKQLSNLYKNARVSRLSIPKKRKGAFAHLKLYGIAGANSAAWLYCTSANCTDAAWQGPNVEAGILRSIPRSELSNYFVADDTALPQATLAYAQKGLAGDMLRFWASDTGSRIEIVTAANCASYLPLHDVTMTVRSGSSLASCRKATLFEAGHVAHIDWSLFPDWERRRKMAICLDIEATAATGEAVRGRSFVENRLLLTADPIHRSAWRGALTLLSEEGAPELADIAAIFTLARDVFDGTLIRLPKAAPTAGGEAQLGNERTPVAIAVWPPQPDTRELQRKIGGTAVGQLQWFQRILQTLLQNDKSESNPHTFSDSRTLSDGEDASEAEERREEEEKRVRSVAERVWAKAEKDYEYLYSRLFELVPTAENAPNIWPAAVFAFLSTMAVFRAVRRMAPGVDFGVDAQTLCNDFVRVMLNERKQHDDFCCPKGFRYRHEKFPALTGDLRKTFKVQLHFDLTTVVLALLVDQKLRSPAGITSQFWQRRAQQVCDEGFAADANTLEACQRIWRRYLRDETRKATDAEFAEAFKVLCASKLPSGGL